MIWPASAQSKSLETTVINFYYYCFFLLLSRLSFFIRLDCAALWRTHSWFRSMTINIRRRAESANALIGLAAEFRRLISLRSNFTVVAVARNAPIHNCENKCKDSQNKCTFAYHLLAIHITCSRIQLSNRQIDGGGGDSIRFFFGCFVSNPDKQV